MIKWWFWKGPFSCSAFLLAHDQVLSSVSIFWSCATILLTNCVHNLVDPSLCILWPWIWHPMFPWNIHLQYHMGTQPGTPQFEHSLQSLCLNIIHQHQPFHRFIIHIIGKCLLQSMIVREWKSYIMLLVQVSPYSKSFVYIKCSLQFELKLNSVNYFATAGRCIAVSVSFILSFAIFILLPH
jgi:hypothetical protein